MNRIAINIAASTLALSIGTAVFLSNSALARPDSPRSAPAQEAIQLHSQAIRSIQQGRLADALTEIERAGKPLIFVVNGATPKAKITYEAAVALSQHGTVAPVTLHHRTDFAASMIDGRTVMEVDANSRSAKEVVELWDYIADRLEKNFRRTVFSAPGGIVPHPLAQRPASGFGRRVIGQ